MINILDIQFRLIDKGVRPSIAFHPIMEDIIELKLSETAQVAGAGANFLKKKIAGIAGKYAGAGQKMIRLKLSKKALADSMSYEKSILTRMQAVAKSTGSKPQNMANKIAAQSEKIQRMNATLVKYNKAIAAG